MHHFPVLYIFAKNILNKLTFKKGVQDKCMQIGQRDRQSLQMYQETFLFMPLFIATYLIKSTHA